MINLNEQQLKNLDNFLARVELKGAEVNAFNDLVKAIFGGQVVPNNQEVPVEKVEEAEVIPEVKEIEDKQEKGKK
jgi:hypothetical protein